MACQYIDPNPLTSLNNQGHNYFLSQNPYALNSYAGFGEAYYNVAPDLKLTGGLRWTDDQKHFVDIPSELLVAGYGYPITVSSIRIGRSLPAASPPIGRRNWISRIRRCSTHPLRMAIRPAAPIHRALSCWCFLEVDQEIRLASLLQFTR